MAGILNHTIVNLIEKKTSDDVKKNFVGVFPSNYVTIFITFQSMMTETAARYPFVIMNADHSDKKRHKFVEFSWFISNKRNLFIWQFWFLLQDDRKTLNKILFGIKKIEKKDEKVNIITLTFSMNEYEK